jgi:selenoprotein W-related protein
MEELLDTYGSTLTAVTLEPRSGGMFEVTYDGLLIFSKRRLSRFPEQGEIVQTIEQLKAEPHIRAKLFALGVARRSPRFIKKIGKRFLVPVLTRMVAGKQKRA